LGFSQEGEQVVVVWGFRDGWVVFVGGVLMEVLEIRGELDVGTEGEGSVGLDSEEGTVDGGEPVDGVGEVVEEGLLFGGGLVVFLGRAIGSFDAEASEFAEVAVEDVVEMAFVSDDAVEVGGVGEEGRDGFGAGGEGFAVGGEFVDGLVVGRLEGVFVGMVLDVVFEEVVFVALEALEAPEGGGDAEGEGVFEGAVGGDGLDDIAVEGVPVVGVFDGGEYGDFCVDAVGDGVAGGFLFALGGFGAGAVAGVGAVGGELFGG